MVRFLEKKRSDSAKNKFPGKIVALIDNIDILELFGLMRLNFSKILVLIPGYIHGVVGY